MSVSLSFGMVWIEMPMTKWQLSIKSSLSFGTVWIEISVPKREQIQ